MDNKQNTNNIRSLFHTIWNSPLARALVLAALLALSGFSAYNIAFSSASSLVGLEIVCLPSAGSCSILKSGTGIIVIDAGTEDDAALLLDYLHENNIKKIDAMIITSDDPYCCSGAAEIVGNVMVEQLIVPDMGDYPSNAWGRALTAASKEGISPTVISEDSAFILQNTSFLLLPVNRDGQKADVVRAASSSKNSEETGTALSAEGSSVAEATLPTSNSPAAENALSTSNRPAAENAPSTSNRPAAENALSTSNSPAAENALSTSSSSAAENDNISLEEDGAAVAPPPPCCLFVSVMYGSGTALFTGNAPDKAIVSYLSGELGGKHDVLMLPQNGKMFDSLKALLSASAPSSVVISCTSAGAVDNSVSKLISAAKARTYLSCDGEIRISSGGRKMKVRQ